MENIPTAEEILKEYNGHNHSVDCGCSCRYRDLVAMKKFAQLHIEACKQDIIKKAQIISETKSDGYECWNIEVISEQSILSAYPLENIK